MRFSPHGYPKDPRHGVNTANLLEIRHFLGQQLLEASLPFDQINTELVGGRRQCRLRRYFVKVEAANVGPDPFAQGFVGRQPLPIHLLKVFLGSVIVEVVHLLGFILRSPASLSLPCLPRALATFTYLARAMAGLGRTLKGL